MIVSKVESMIVGLPFQMGGNEALDQQKWSIQNITRITHLLVRLETECGLVGWGEGFAFKGAQALKEVVDELIAPALVGRETGDVQATNQRLQFENHLWGRYGLTMFGISAVDIALWDLAGKKAGKPLYELLGGERQQLTAYASLPRYGNGNVAVSIARRAVDEGYRYVKLHEVEPDIVAQVREAIGPDIGLMTDTNCPWTEQQAIAAARQMQGSNLMWLEEPIFPPEDYATLARVQKQGGIPLSAGECACTAFEFRQMFDAGAVTYAQPSVTKVGGITEFIKVVDLAREYGVQIMPHAPYFGPGYIANLHLLSALAPQGLVERLYLGAVPEEFYGTAAIPEQGTIRAPGGPGLGLDPDQDVIEKYRTG